MVVVMEERATDPQIRTRDCAAGGNGHGRASLHRRHADGARRGRRSGSPMPRLIEMLDGVHEVLRITEPYKLASRTFKPETR